MTQTRVTLMQSGLSLYKRVDATTILLKNDENKLEVWDLHDDYAGYTIEIDNVGYEFIKTYNPEIDYL